MLIVLTQLFSATLTRRHRIYLRRDSPTSMLLAKVILEGPELDLNFFGFVKKGAPAAVDQSKYHKILFEQAFLTLFWLGMVSAGPARRGKGSRTICSLGISDLSCLK